MKQLDLSIIIVSYNTKDILIDCIKSIINNTKTITFEIIVVDNASVDGTTEQIQNSKFKSQSATWRTKVKIINNKENIGFAAANNIGVKQASGKYILFLNSDTIVFENTLHEMVKFMNTHEKAGAATCFVELPSGELDDAAHRGFPTPTNSLFHFSRLSKLLPKYKLFNGYSLSYLNFNTIHEIDACAGAFMLVRRQAGEEVGWWDENYFWYGEDLDFCYRLKQKGWKIYFVPTVKILHYKGVSGGIKKISKHLTRASLDTRLKAIDDRFEAMKIFYQKHYQKKYPTFINSLVLLGIRLKWLLAKRQIKNRENRN